jgi:hypothetical protein
MNILDILVKRARIAAGISWETGKDSNKTEPQEPEVRNILRDCATAIESLKAYSVPDEPFTIQIGGKTRGCEQCGVSLFRKQADNNRMSPRDTPAIRCECNHCGEPCDILFRSYS